MQSCKKFQSCRTPLILALCMKNYKIAVNAAANVNTKLLPPSLSLQSPMATALAETNYHHALSISTDPSAVAGLWLPSPPPPPHSDPASFLSRQLSPISPYQVCNHAHETTILIITH